MDAQALIIWLIVGGVAGWLAGMVVKGGGYGLIGDIISLGLSAASSLAGYCRSSALQSAAELSLRSSMPSSAQSSCYLFCDWPGGRPSQQKP